MRDQYRDKPRSRSSFFFTFSKKDIITGPGANRPLNYQTGQLGWGRMQIIGIFLSFVISSTAFAISAHRYSNEDYRAAAARHTDGGAGPLNNLSSPYAVRVAYYKLETSNQSDFDSYAEMMQFFTLLRDKQFIEYHGNRRRSSWLYPADGCWVRADLMNKNLRVEGRSPLKKVFVFGPLQVETPYSSTGAVTWWYHVTVIARVEGKNYVLDPAIEPRYPLLLEEWILKQVDSLDEVTLSICSPDVFAPEWDDCHSKQPMDVDTVIYSQKPFLNLEEDLLRSLGFDAEGYLGDSPPWRILR